MNISSITNPQTKAGTAAGNSRRELGKDDFLQILTMMLR